MLPSCGTLPLLRHNGRCSGRMHSAAGCTPNRHERAGRGFEQALPDLLVPRHRGLIGGPFRPLVSPEGPDRGSYQGHQ